MAILRVRLREEIRLYAVIERTPVAAAVVGLEDSSAGHADIHVRRIARIDLNRMQLRTVRRAVLVAAAPCLTLRMLVEAIHSPPRCSVVVRHEQSLRRRSRIPDARARRVARRQPERVVDDAIAALMKRRRL